MHINCVGSGSPTVIFDTGLGGTSASWTNVLEEARDVTRLCAFDRTGNGWSELGPGPINAASRIADLEKLLEAADEPGPYILTGWSLGGGLSWLYAQNKPEQVVGLILVDGVPPNIADLANATGDNEPLPGWFASLSTMGLRPALFSLMGMSGQEPFISPGLIDEMAAIRDMQSDFESMDDLGDLPLILFTHDRGTVLGGWTDEIDGMWQDAQQEMAGLSTQSQLIVAPSNHQDMPFEQAGMIADAIRKLVDAHRTAGEVEAEMPPS